MLWEFQFTTRNKANIASVFKWKWYRQTFLVQQNNLNDKTRNENSKQLDYVCSKIFMQDPTNYTKSWWRAFHISILIFATILTWCTFFWTNKYLSTIIPTYHGTLFWKNKDAQVRKRCPTSIQYRLKNTHTHTHTLLFEKSLTQLIPIEVLSSTNMK